MWARIENGIVTEVTDRDPTGRFHPSIPWIECGEGVVPGWHYDGEAFSAPPGPDYKQLREQTLNAIDQAAGSARAQFASPGALIDEEYRQALNAVNTWRAAGSPADAVPPEIQSGADYSGINAEAAAVEIEQTAIAWDATIAQIRDLRLTGKRAVKDAPDAEIETVAQGYLEQLAGIKPVEA